jgi:hypothetical protein
MSSTKRRLAVVPSSRPSDPARVQLDAAIKNAAKARAALAAHQAAIARAGEQLAESERRVDTARAGIESARHAFEGEMAAALSAGRAIPATSQVLGRADAAVVEAQRTADAVRAARERLRADLRSCEVDNHLAKNDIATAVDQIMAPLAAKMLAQAEAARRVLFESAAILSFLAHPDDAFRFDQFWKPDEWRVSSDAGKKRRAAIDDEVRKGIEAYLAHFRQDIGLDVHRTLDAWKAAREALKTDASAELLKLPGET